MNMFERKKAFATLGKCLNAYVNRDITETDSVSGSGTYHRIGQSIDNAVKHNIWFTKPNIIQAIETIANNMLKLELINEWLNNYTFKAETDRSFKKIGIIMAGNIPLVGFHDLLCVLICGYCAKIKTSSKDTILIQTITQILCNIEPRFKQYIEFSLQRPTEIDAIISTGSNNSARYFLSWYKNTPHIIRKNRNSIAILTGKESYEDLRLLSKDIFSYFGLGCRNISTLLVPKTYNFDNLFNNLSNYSFMNEHKGYNDCYRYQKAILNLSATPHFDNGFAIIKENTSFVAPIALLNYQKYTNLDFVKELISNRKNEIQCIACQNNFIENSIKFGETQQPKLNDYADNIDTIEFILNC